MSQQKTDLERAMLVMDKLARQNAKLKNARSEPIAIVGIGLRFPGGCTDPESFWSFLERGGDGIVSIAERWALAGIEPPPNTPKWAGLLDGLDTFDPEFFGISPREAQKLDPQHRLLLEVSWQALENAGIEPASLGSTRSGVFLGACATDYIHVMDRAAPGHTDAYSTTGNMNSVAAGRLSYTLGLNGPAITVDTACSSSLVSTHLACLSLRNRECDFALAGGVNVILSERTMVGLASSQALSPDGRCYTFDARANGYARGEGCGIVALKRLSDAERDGDRIWAVIRSSVVNQDGRSTGLTAPNVLSQQALLKEALTRAKLKPDAIGFVESHGTATSLGDPIEVDALRAVYGAPRADDARCYLGALKANTGHLEGSAGIAGLIKTALVLAHERIPKNINFRTLNPRISLKGSALTLPTKPVDWPRSETPRFGGVSSFGFSGTNAHIILGEAPTAAAVGSLAPCLRSARLVLLSAVNAAALDAQVAQLAAHVDAHPDQRVIDMAYSLATSRAHHACRVGFVAESRETLRVALAQGVAGGVVGQTSVDPGKTAWMFTGQGSQTNGMGRQLYDEWPVFRAALDRCVALFARELPRPLLDIMWAARESEDAALLNDTRYTQPALFAVGYALGELWKSFGVTPDIVAGHSIGEITAACLAGIMSVDDAARLVAARGRLMGGLPAGGAMCSIRASEADVRQAIGDDPDVGVATINTKTQVVVSGAVASVAAVAEVFAARGVRVKRLSVSHAFHSPMMDPILADFRRVADAIQYQPAGLPIVSNLTGKLAGPEISTGGYWVDHIRRAVRFSDGLRALHIAGARTFVELGPDSTLCSFARVQLQAEAPTLLASLRKGRNETATMLAALGGWFVRGGAVDWSGVYSDARARVNMPAYAFQRRRHWIAPTAATDSPVALVAGGETGAWVLAGTRLPLPGASEHRIVPISLGHQPYLNDHRIFGRVVVPGAFYLATMLAMAAERWPGSGLVVEDVEFLRALDFDDDQDVALHAVITPVDGGKSCAIELVSEQIAGDSATWVVHAKGRAAPVSAPQASFPIAQVNADTPLDVEAFYDELTSMRITWGPTWRWIDSARVGEGCSIGRISPKLDDIDRVAPLHPVMIDNCLGGGMLHAMGVGADRTPRLPIGVKRMTLFAPWAGDVDSQGVARESGATLQADLLVSDTDGSPLLQIEGLMARRAPRELLLRSAGDAAAGLKRRFVMAWDALTAVDADAPRAGRWLIIGVPGAPVHALAEQIRGADRAVDTLTLGVDVDGFDAAAVRAAIVAAGPSAGVICLWQGDASPDERGTAHRLAASALHILQAAQAELDGAPMWWVTSGAHSDGVTLPSQTSVWGLGRAWQQEQASVPLMLLDLPTGTSVSDAVGGVVRELGTHDNEPQVRLHGAVRQGARLARANPPGGEISERLLSGPGAVVITGGCGALGMHAARWLADRGVEHIVLMNRSSPDAPELLAAIDDVVQRGATVQIAVADVSDRDAVSRALANIPDATPLRGIVHAAGVTDDGFVASQTRGRLAHVLAPKVDGAWNLHELTAHASLDLFVLYSSAASVLGSAGQSSYAAANGFLDGLARMRRHAGQPALSLQWGPWAGGGMESRLDEAIRARLLRWGMTLLTPEQAVLHMDEALAEGATELMVSAFDVGASRQARVPPVLSRLMPNTSGSGSPKASDIAAQLRGLPEAEHLGAVLNMVRSVIAETLAAGSIAAIPPGAQLRDLGLDSLMAVELQSALSQRVGADLPATLALDIPTAQGIAEYLLSEVLDLSDPEDAPAVVVERTPSGSLNEAIAIVGMGCRLPGGVTDPESFWQLLDQGRDAVTEIPSDRWDVDEWYDPDPRAPGKMSTRWGGFLPNVDTFDARFFNMKEREAVAIDPQQRVLLEVTWEAIERAGLTPATLAGSQTGVYVGITGNDYQHNATADVAAINPYSLMGSAHSAIAGRLAFWLGLRGPTFPVDTACSSSLVAVHLACQGLRNGECNMALAGGVNLVIKPEGSVWFSKLKVLSPTGRTRSFSAQADGFVRSEGCGVVVLKRLSDAEADGDNILAVIRGSAVNHNGGGSNFVVPNGGAQQEVIARALAQGSVAPADVGYVECQGTATPLGDAIEAQALAATFAPGRDPARPLLIGSAKSNLGHTESASGIAGLIKTVLCLQNERVPASLHCDTPNERLPWARMPMRVAQTSQPWPGDGARVAGVSAFGITGTNAHAVLSRYEGAPPVVSSPPADVSAPQLFVMSGRAPAAVDAMVERVAGLDAGTGDIAWSLATARTHFEHRLAVVASNAAELRAALLSGSAGRVGPPSARGEVGENQYTALILGGVALPLADETWPAYRDAVQACADALPSALSTDAGAAFAARYATLVMWRAFGARPKRVVGRGVGALAAAVVAGGLSLADALALVTGASAQVTLGAMSFPVVVAATGAPLVAGLFSASDAAALAASDASVVDACLADVGVVIDTSAADRISTLAAVGAWFVQGGDVDWPAVLISGQRVRLPAYPWQRERYWIDG